MPQVNVAVNQKVVIKTFRYYHCFKLSDSEYALFDVKMDMPIVIASIAIIKSMKLPVGSTVFYYKFNGTFFEKAPEKTIEVDGDGKHTKPPIRFKVIDKNMLLYHHFQLDSVTAVLFDSYLDQPIAYGSNQRVAAVISKLEKFVTIAYYKEDGSVKHSFKKWALYAGKKPKK